jgi:hypothetical protein
VAHAESLLTFGAGIRKDLPKDTDLQNVIDRDRGRGRCPVVQAGAV